MKIITTKRMIKFGGILLTCLLIVSVVAIPPALAQGNGKEKGNRYIVVIKESASPEEIIRDHGLAPRHIYTHALNGLATQRIGRGKLADLREDLRVKFVEKDKKVHALGQTLPTGIDRVEADKNDTANINNSDDRVDVDIAIIDTGIDEDHPDLNVYTGRNFARGPDWKYDDGNGHGTHVAGTAAALDDGKGVVGMAPGARLWAVRVLNNDGSGWLSDVIAGVDYVTKNSDEIEVANMSLGAQGKSDSFRESIQNSVAAGVVYVVAAGNDEKDVYGGDGTFGNDDDFIPAAYPEVATISAMADSDGEPGGNGSDTSYGSDDSFASFSNFSASVVANNPVDSPGAAIDLLLPGVDIYSTYKDGGYATMSGTSMSSPHGAGLAALYIAKNGRDVVEDGENNENDVYKIRQALIDEGVAQDSSNGLVTLNDPDDNWERIGWASSATGDSPIASWIAPTDGELVENLENIRIYASDNETSKENLTVRWNVDGGNWRGTEYNSSENWFENIWDTTEVPDGNHNLSAEVTDSDNNTSTANITVDVQNYDNAPTISWINPSDGDTVSDNVIVQIEAKDDLDNDNNLTVKWKVDDNEWRKATFNENTGHYENIWDTTQISDDNYTLTAKAVDSDSNETKENISVAVSNEAGGMYVWDISWRETGPHLKATVTILVDSDGDGVAESSDDPVSDAAVDFTLSNENTNENQSYTGTTDSKGEVEFQWKFAPSGKYKGEVTDLTHSSYEWNSSLDADNPDYYKVQ